jgi:Chromo (CHRromatin Organisation MOdifier) domain
MSTAYHPQSDGQTERVNQCLENYLRDMLLDQQRKWTRWLPLAQWWYNINFHRSLQSTPFQALFGYPPPQLPLDHPPKSSIEAVDMLLRTRHRQLTQLRFNLLKAHERMKKFTDTNRTEQKFDVSDWVYIKLQPYRQLYVSKRHNHKLGPRFYGPFEVEDRIGTVAYRLRLPIGSTIHPVLHVSQVKRHIKHDQPVSPSLPLLNSDGQLKIYPKYILARRAIKRDNQAIPRILVKWSNLSEDDASWEDYETIRSTYPTAILEDKNDFEGRGVLAHLCTGEMEEIYKEARSGTNIRRRDAVSQHGQELESLTKGTRHLNLLTVSTVGSIG